ncbi:MAG: rRNA pseudouridine synthase [Ruminococcaceae bacterium]|nr:rRNA pseudouridine synthase [Oscillospiraceae bacterium]
MEKVRLQKFIADAGLMSRRAAEDEIERGNMSVNGHVATLGTKIDPKNDVVTYKGKRIRYERREHTYIMLNKPRGYLSTTTDDRGRKCVTDLLEGISARVYPVGRLDMISEGMILLTDDGELKNRLTHPSHEIGKVYRVKVGGSVSEEQMDILTSPLVIDGYKIKPVEVTVSSEDEGGTVLKMTLFEGRNRQIRKMCEEAGLTVRRLSRVSIGNLKLDGLPVGKWRYLENSEVEYLYKATRNVKNV